jgi:hypothetical protein
MMKKRCLKLHFCLARVVGRRNNCPDYLNPPGQPGTNCGSGRAATDQAEFNGFLNIQYEKRHSIWDASDFVYVFCTVVPSMNNRSKNRKCRLLNDTASLSKKGNWQ